MAMGNNNSSNKGWRLTNPEFHNGRLYNQDYQTIKDDLLQNQVSNDFFVNGSNNFFNDPWFPPDKYSLSFSGSIDGLNIDLDDVSWVRAKDLYPNAEFIINGSSKDDVNQGSLGDCWFLSSLAGLAEHKELFKKVVPEGQIMKSDDYCGIFKFCFWKWGQWVEVVVDDRIPVYQGNPLFTYSDDYGEVWPMLLEKAFAKLHGSYFHLVGGFTVAALECLTGGLSERFVGNQGPAVSMRGSQNIHNNLFNKISNILQNGGIVCTGTLLMDKLSSGIFGGHAYSVTGTYELTSLEEQHIQLIKIRNPWGNQVEWIGPWSDKSEEMKQVTGHQKKALKTGTGEFWMNFQDFLDYFTLVEFTHILTDWTEPTYFTGMWINKNHCDFLLTMFQDEEVFVSLEQKYSRELRDEHEEVYTSQIGLTIFSLPTGIGFEDTQSSRSSNLDLGNLEGYLDCQLHFGNNADWKEVTTVTFHDNLKKGSYLIRAERLSEYGTKDFFLRVHSRSGKYQLAVN